MASSRFYKFGQGGISDVTQIDRMQFPIDRGVEEERMKPPVAEQVIFGDSTLAKRETPLEFLYDQRLDEIHKEIQLLKNQVKDLKQHKSVFLSKITSIPSEKYELRKPIDAIIKIYEEEVIALIPELELFGEGSNEFEALNDLKFELIDLLEDLDFYPDEKLGSTPKAWNKTLRSMVKECR